MIIHKKLILNFTYNTCSIINTSINTHEIHKCPRGEIGRHKGLKILALLGVLVQSGRGHH